MDSPPPSPPSSPPDLNTSIICPVPYTTAMYDGAIPCGITYAQALGDHYIITRGVMIAFTSLLMIATYIQCIRLIQHRGYYPFQQIHGIYLCAVFSATSQFIRSPDPQGWANLYPHEFMQLLADLSSAAIIIFCFIVTMSWLKLMRRIMGKQPNRWLTIFEYVVPPAFFVWTGLISLLQSDVHTPGTWLFTMLKFLVFIIFILTFIIMGWTQGAPLFIELNRPISATQAAPQPSPPSRTRGLGTTTGNTVTELSPRPFMHMNSVKSLSPANPLLPNFIDPSNENNDDTITAHHIAIEMMEITPIEGNDAPSAASSDAAQSVLESLAALPTATPSPPPNHVSQFQSGSKRKAKMTLIIKLLMVMTIVALFAVAYMLQRIAGDASLKYDDRYRPKPPPTGTFSSILSSLAFPIVEYVAIVVVLIFFRHMKPLYSGGPHDSTAHPSRNTPKVTQCKNPTPNPNLNPNPNPNPSPSPSPSPSPTPNNAS